MNVNGQNGVATSALKNAVVKAVKMINKAENAKVGSVKIYDMYRLSFDGARFIKGDKDNFIFNGKIEQKGSNGRFNMGLVEIHYKNLDNDGLCLDDMVNAVIDAILNALDDTIVKYESNGHAWERMFAWDLQEFRYWYFGSRLAVDNTDDLNSPDALDNDEPDALNIDEDYNLEFLRNRMPVIPIDLIKQGVDEYLNDEYEYRRNSGTGRFECDFEEFADKVWEKVWALVLDNDLSDEFIEYDTRNYMEFNDRLYYMIDSENINGLFLHNDNVCQNFDDDENDGADGFEGFENASEICDNNMMACVDKYGQVFIDAVLDKYADVVCNAVSEYDLLDTVEYCVKGALDNMEYDPDKKRLVGCSLVPDLDEWDDEEEFCNYFENAYGFDEDSCLEFYEEYCNDIWHFANEYDDQMEDTLRYFDEESVFDKMPYKVYYNNEGYINVYIDMDDFVDFIKNNLVFNDSKAQLFNEENLGLKLYYMLDPDNKNIEQFYKDLIDMTPMVTDVKLYDDGLYLWYKDMTDMTIREFYELHNDGYGCTEEPINNYVDEFMCSSAVEVFENLVEKDEDWRFYIEEDDDSDLSVLGNESIFERYFNDNVPMVQVYDYLMDKMNKEILKIEKVFEKEIEDSKWEVLEAFEIANAQGENSFDVDYDEWWDYVLGETQDWKKDKYFDKFCDVLYGYFVKYAKDYGYVVEKIDGGLSLEMSDNNN